MKKLIILQVRGRVYLDTLIYQTLYNWGSTLIVQGWVGRHGPEVLELKNQIEAKISDKINPSSITKVLSD